MGFELLSKAKGWVGRGLGTDNDEDLTEAANAIRREWYAWYESLNLFVDALECFELQTFYEDCQRCADCYRGVTLPRDFAAVEAMWYDRMPIKKLFGRWRQWHDGISGRCECGLAKHDIGDDFCSERDMIPGQCLPIHVFAMDPRDIGKRLILRVVTIHGPREYSFSLKTEPQATGLPVKSIQRRGGVSKDMTQGRVCITDSSGRVLSIYAPGETAPAYKRIKITGLPSGCASVNILAARKYIELFDPYDVVESDNQRAWESMARYLRLNRKADRTRDDIASEASYLGQVRTLLLGDKARQQGKSTRVDFKVLTPNLNLRRLNRTR